MDVGILTLISRRAGGLFYSVRWLSMALQRAGCGVRVFSARDRYTEEDLPQWEPLEVGLYSSIGPLQSAIGLRPMLAKADADLLHVHGIWLDRQWAALQWQKRTGRPVVLSPRGMLDPWAVNNSAWKKKLAGALFANESLRKASCIHALCRSEAESIRAYGLKNPIALIPNGVELPLIDRQQPAGDDHRSRNLLFLGRIHPKKGIAELLRGWAEIVRRRPAEMGEWKLLVAGWDDGGHQAGFERLRDELGLAGSVEFPGAQFGEAKEQLLRSVDAFILPSHSEGLPMSVLEAWSYGLPVLMTDFCNLPEGFSVDAALRIEPTPEAIAAGIEKLVAQSEAERSLMGLRGRKLVEEKFTWPRIAQEMKAVYEWRLGGGAPPACVMEE